MTRHTKVLKEPETEVLTKSTRKGVSRKLADVDDVSIAEEDTYVPLVPRKERKPRKKKVPGRKKTDIGDGLAELGKRYENLLRDCFGELNTDRTYDGFSVSCQVMLGSVPGTLWVCSKLCKNGHPIHLREGYVLHYPNDVRELAIDLYGEMCYNGLEIADLLGV